MKFISATLKKIFDDIWIEIMIKSHQKFATLI